MIKQRDLNMIYISGPGHGGSGLVANAYLKGTYTEEVYPNISPDEEGMKCLFTQFLFPGIPSHVAQETPVRFHEGGELGYASIYH